MQGCVKTRRSRYRSTQAPRIHVAFVATVIPMEYLAPPRDAKSVRIAEVFFVTRRCAENVDGFGPRTSEPVLRENSQFGKRRHTGYLRVPSSVC